MQHAAPLRETLGRDRFESQPPANGASVLEGYVPEFDATIVTRLHDAGADIVGKSVCQYFSFSGGAATTRASQTRHMMKRRKYACLQ
jgi:amidase